MHGSLSITEFYSVSSHPSNGLLLAGGTQDNGTLVFQGNLGWSLITGGDGGDTVLRSEPAEPDPVRRSGVVLHREWQQRVPVLPLPDRRLPDALDRHRPQRRRAVHPAHGHGPVESVHDVADGRASVPHRQPRARTGRRRRRRSAPTSAAGWIRRTAASCAPARYFTAVAVAPTVVRRRCTQARSTATSG